MLCTKPTANAFSIIHIGFAIAHSYGMNGTNACANTAALTLERVNRDTKTRRLSSYVPLPLIPSDDTAAASAAVAKYAGLFGI